MGVISGAYNIALDGRDPSANVNFVSHAHSDHTSGIRRGRSIIASDATKSLIKERYGIEAAEANLCSDIRLLNAGHILGSRQLYAESDCGSMLYSGDYLLQPSPVAERIEFTKADILIIDSTYPERSVKFDDRGDVTDNISKYTERKLDKGIVLFGAYAVGKAQELISIFNEKGILPVVDRSISRMSRVYAKHCIRLKYASIDENNEALEEATKGNFVGIVSMHRLNELKGKISGFYGKTVFTAVATGFAKIMRFGADAQFALSDHADFYQATEYIDNVCPEKIYTVGKGREVFAQNLADEGYNAFPMDPSLGICSR